jgi:chromosome segregation ATPase
MMSELQDEYSGKTEQLVLESGEERTALRREIAAIEESITRVSSELTEKTRDSLDTLKEQSESYLLEFRKNSREARDDVERKIKELRQSVQESRDKAESNRKEMTAHTDTEYARLMRNLDEIDRRQREFISETRVFERADEMKELLEADIAELNRQLEVVGSGRDEIRIINDQYEKAISLYDEVNSKLARFLSEQQKVENLEGKIARIGSLSESVDLKLDRVTDANDTLQDLQLRLKQLEDLHEDLGGRYERLSEKSHVLDAATDGVDKNFERMTRIEDILKDVAERVLPLRDDLNKAEERQRSLEEEREKIDLVVGKVSTIDVTIAELDKKLEDLGKAREWLARTETRLEEINRETQQRVRLLGTLSKREAGGKKSSGSPDMSTREMVVKLAREGWNSEEIATNLKLSRGEVELILELQPKN